MVRLVCLDMPTSPPASMAINVTAAQAAVIGEQQLAAEGNSDMVLDTAELRIVAVGAMTPSPTGVPVAATARLAWVLSAYSPGHCRFMWVDTASGQIVGGDNAYFAAAPPAEGAAGAAAEIEAAIKGAREIVVSGRGPRLAWVELAKWGAGSEGFAMVTSASAVGALLKPRLAPYKMALGSGMTLYYFPEQNLLGVPGCWLKVSPQLASLVKNLPVPASPAPAKKP
jgi:hypothetical protein